jgi:hypothetical protein
MENPTAPGVVTGDETRLRQVITNLARYIDFHVDRYVELIAHLTAMLASLHPQVVNS